MPLTVTTVPAVVDALVQLATTHLVGVTVFDGPYNSDDIPDEFFCVGFSRDEEDASVDGVASRTENLMTAETYAVHCILSVATGDTDRAAIAERRTRCGTLFALFAVKLRSDPQLAGALQADGTATITDFSWIYGPAETGSYAEIEFDVSVTAGYLGAT
jgi:hypothetical protein